MKIVTFIQITSKVCQMRNTLDWLNYVDGIQTEQNNESKMRSKLTALFVFKPIKIFTLYLQ